MEQLLAELQHLGIRLKLEGDDLHVSARAGALDERLRQALRQHKPALIRSLRAGAQREAEAAPLEHDAAARFEPFPLTELQHAYWLGRDAALEMGSIATHLYVELACRDFDLPRANRALCELIRRHDMLRAVVDGEGQQRVLPAVPDYVIACTRCEHDVAAGEAAVQATRDALSHQVLRADRWPLFDIRATSLPCSEVRLHVSLDLLILDAWSIFLFFREWHALYRDASAGARPRIGYRDYVLAERSRRTGPAYAAAQAYWEARIDRLPPAPALPLRADPAARRSPRFSRREARLAAPRWERLKQLARDHGLTPSGAILGAYAEVLARWSETAHFTLNVTTGSRQPWHPEVHQLLGDFTSLVLHEVDRRDARSSFAGFAAQQQRRLLEDLDHDVYSGLNVRREWARRHGITLQAALPVVFSSGLIWSGDAEVGNLEQFGPKVYSISQTSQVWLDHHVMELGGELVLIWDAVDAVFEPGVLDAMFEAYTALVDRLAGDPGAWDEADVVALPPAQQARRRAAADTAAPLSAEALHAAIVAAAQTRPEAVALIAAGRSLSFGAWLGESCAWADALLDAGVQPGEPVAVVMHKGWEQPVAVLAALLAGGAYVPIDADLPVRRQAELLGLSGARRVLTQPHAWRVDPGGLATPLQVLAVREGPSAPFGARHAPSLVGAARRLAYVIFTSGTTGVPKGVMIEHGAAVNTVQAVNRRFGIGPGDRTLGVSSLSFDLSVYDIFGVPAAGGALVLPDARAGHDAAHWLETLRSGHVTLWNSAPQLMRMLLDCVPLGDTTLAQLSTVLLSGDFIPLDLPARLRDHGFGGRFVSLGGATEAAIWSICHPVAQVDPAWASIPYGRALPNQTVQVLDAALRSVPDHVRGRIYIGGQGLARAYLGDPEKTAQRFVIHPRSGERLYDTGDLGRYDPQGDIVILGRDDGQIKVRGHRVELGEIEAVLRRHAGVDQAVVVARPGADGTPTLAAYVVPATSDAAPPDAAELRLHMAESLPDYMVPRQLALLDSLPLSPNGKLDLAALPPLLPGSPDAQAKVGPRDAVEAAVLAAWSGVIPGFDIGVTDNFFDLGGDSVLATQLLRELNAALPLAQPLEMHELFENLTIEALAALVKARQGLRNAAAGVESVAEPARGLAPVASLWADVEFGRSGVRERLAGRLAAQPGEAPPRNVLLTGATGWVGLHLLAALLLHRDCDVVCLVRGTSEREARARLLDLLADTCGLHGPVLQRVHVVCGDVTQPRLGLSETLWSALAEGVDAVFHLAATVGVLHDYATHRHSNVEPLHELLRLATQGRSKPLHALSPMAVCRRWLGGEQGLQVDTAERVGESPEGLLTAYAQSKWVAEQVLWAAGEAGLPIRLYRCSHALPSSDRGRGKAYDTYGTVLTLAGRVHLLPDWPDARVHGLPVDRLAELMVEDACSAWQGSALVHLEPSQSPTLREVLAALLRGSGGSGEAPTVPLEAWRLACLEAAASLPPAEQALAQGLLERRGGRLPLENMYTGHRFETRARVGPVPPDYWRRVYGPAEAPVAQRVARRVVQ